MHRIFAMPWLLIGGLSALFLGGVPAVSLAQTCSTETKPLIVLLGSTTRLQLASKKPIKTVLNTKEATLTLRTVERDPTTVLLVGTAPGITEIQLEDSDGNREVRKVIVQADVEYLTSQLKRAVPLSNIDVMPNGTNSVILTGYTSRAEDIAILEQVARSAGFEVINGVRLDGVQQVQLDVVIARVSRTKGRNFGFNFVTNSHNSIFAQTTGNLATLASPIGLPAAVLPNITPGASTNLFGGVIGNNSGFLGFLQALQVEGVAKILAQPRLVTKSGQAANFLDGGEYPIPVVGALSAAAGVTYKKFGTQLVFLPIVLGNGRIHLEVEPEVSAVGPPGLLTTAPQFITQAVHTAVEMESGQTFVIGGLIQKTSSVTATKVPYIGQLPFLGALFSTKTAAEEESELIIMVTPHLVDAQSACQVSKVLPGQESRTPDNFELFLEGILEAPRGPRKVFHGNRYVPAHLGGPTAGVFPCGGQDDGIHSQRITGRAGCGAGGACSSEAPGSLAAPSAGVAAPVTMTPGLAGTMPTPEIVAPPAAMPRGDTRVLPAPPGGNLSAQTPTDTNPKAEESKPAEAIRLADPVRPPETLPPISSVPGVR